MTSRLRISLLLCTAGLLGCDRPVAGPPATWNPDATTEAYHASVGALMSPWSTRAFMVTPKGDLFNGAWWVRLRPSSDGVPAGAPRVIAAEDRWMPVLHWRRMGGDLQWDFEAVAHAAPAPGWFEPGGALDVWSEARSRRDGRRQEDAAYDRLPLSRLDTLLGQVRRPIERETFDRRGLFVSLSVRVTNHGTRAHVARLAAVAEHGDRKAPFRAPDADADSADALAWAGDTRSSRVVALGDSASTTSGSSAGWSLAPGASREERFVLSAYPVETRTLAAWARVPHAQRVSDARRYWIRAVERGTRFALGDTTVERAVDAARVVLLSLRERRGGLAVPIGGPFHYRDVWLRDGARAIQALAISGYEHEAADLLPALLEFQWPHGPFMSQSGQLDGSGQALWTMDQVLSRTLPAAGVDRYADAARRAWGARERQRSIAVADGMVAGMLPTANPHDNELVKGQLVGNDAWAIAGYRATARLLREAGRPSDAERVEASLARYLVDFGRAIERVRSNDIPPAWAGPGHDWGNLSVAWPCGALPVDHPRIARLAERYFDASGHAGAGHYGDRNLRHGYVAADLATWALLTGRRETADQILDELLRWRSASGGAAETFVRSSRDFERNFPPHPTSAAALLALVRNSVLYDDDDTLRLTMGARAQWWRGAKIDGAPTRWGRINVAFSRQADRARWTWSPVRAWASLTLPPGTVLAAAPGGGILGAPGDRLVRVPPGMGEVEVVVNNAPRPVAPRREAIASRIDDEDDWLNAPAR